MSAQALTHVEERDIDLLILEELSASAAFRSWFLEQVLREGWTIISSRSLHSTSRSGADWGETDLEIHLTARRNDHSASIVLLVENKVNAPFTERQAERYKQACGNTHADIAKCVPMCPRGYVEDHPIFDAVIHYESIREFLLQRSRDGDEELSARLRHRAKMLEWAITKSRRSYVPTTDPVNTTFWGSYEALLQTRAPGLRINGGEKGGRAIDVFVKEGLPRIAGCSMRYIQHSFHNGRVTITLGGWAAGGPALVGELQRLLSSEMYVRPTGKSLQIVQDVPPLDTQKPFHPQATSAQIGIDAMKALHDWMMRNLPALDEIGGRFILKRSMKAQAD